MNAPFPAMAALALLLAAGALAGAILLARRIGARRRLEYALDFVERFGRLVVGIKSGEADPGLLTWLAERAPRMQALMGGRGRIEYFSPEGNYIEREFRVVTRTIEEIRDGSRSEHLFSSCQLALIKFLTHLQERSR